MSVRIRRPLRVGRLALCLALGSLMVGFVYPMLGRAARLELRRWWCARVLEALGIRLFVHGTRRRAYGLIAANHVSWLDAVALGVLFPCAFVAKAEARAWPLIGWLSASNETLFLRRDSAKAALRMGARIARRLEERRYVAIFPEGTTTDGASPLRFRAALFEPAVARRHPILPVAIRYRDATGRRSTAPAFVKDVSLWKSMLAVADAPSIEVHVMLAEPIETRGLRRRAAATLAWAAVSDALAASNELRGRQPPVLAADALELA